MWVRDWVGKGVRREVGNQVVDMIKGRVTATADVPKSMWMHNSLKLSP